MTHYNIVNIRLDDRSWQDRANCLGVDPDLFFPERGASTREAKEVCRGCVVRMDCLEYALVNGEKFGIWGGMSERERRRLRRQRAQAARRPSDGLSRRGHGLSGSLLGPRRDRRASMVRSAAEVELRASAPAVPAAARRPARGPPAPRRRPGPGQARRDQVVGRGRPDDGGSHQVHAHLRPLAHGRARAPGCAARGSPPPPAVPARHRRAASQTL